jgi:thiosulfate dehydrogenase [quinone] large subunit
MNRDERLASLPGGWTLSLVRILTGWVFINYGWFSKIRDPKFLPGMEETLRKMADHSAFSFYRAFLVGIAIPHASAFGLCVAWGEALLGLALVLGAFSNLASLLGILMLLNFFLAARSYEALLYAALCLVFLRYCAGSRWGFDTLLSKFLPGRLVYFPRR